MVLHSSSETRWSSTFFAILWSHLPNSLNIVELFSWAWMLMLDSVLNLVVILNSHSTDFRVMCNNCNVIYICNLLFFQSGLWLNLSCSFVWLHTAHRRTPEHAVQQTFQISFIYKPPNYNNSHLVVRLLGTQMVEKVIFKFRKH